MTQLSYHTFIEYLFHGSIINGPWAIINMVIVISVGGPTFLIRCRCQLSVPTMKESSIIHKIIIQHTSSLVAKS